MKSKTVKSVENFTTAPTARRGNGQEDFASSCLVNHLLYMFWLVNLQPRNNSARDATIIINKRNWSHHLSDA